MAMRDFVNDPYDPYRRHMMMAGLLSSPPFDPPRSEQPLRVATHSQQEGHSVIIGKIVLCEGQEVFIRPGADIAEESIVVSMTVHGISISHRHPDVSGRHMSGMSLTSEQSIELGQLLLKAAECQPEYADSVKRLDEERVKLENRYKDMLSGLGLDIEIDVDDSHNTFKVITAS